MKRGKRDAAELRELWRTAIRQTIMLNRMETENAMLQARQNENELKRIKLDYEEIVPCDKQLIERWEQIIERNSTQIGNKKDPKVLGHAIRTGVPRSKRGDGSHYVITHMLRLTLEHVSNVAVVVQLPADDAKVIQRLLAVHTAGHVLKVLVEEHLLAIGRDEAQIASSHQEHHRPVLLHKGRNAALRGGSIPQLGYAENRGVNSWIGTDFSALSGVMRL